jgi:multiple sugar transport system permease protein
LNALIDHTLLISVSAVLLAPFVFVVMTSFMTGAQARTASLWPRPFQPSNYTEVFTTISIVRYTWNTLQIAILSTIGVLVSSIPVAYALARMRWRGRQAAFVLVLATLMLPVQVTIVPLYIVFVRLGWIDHLTPLIVPAFFGDAFSIFLLRQFFMTIPQEMTDAARVDGASEWQIMTRVIVPLAKPAIAAVALFSFLYSWNDLFGPLLFVGNNPKLYTLAIGLTEFTQRYGTAWELMMAASALIMLPVIVLFFLAQKVFIEGVTLTGVKG